MASSSQTTKGRGASVCRSIVRNSLQTPRTVAGQAPLSMEFSRQEYWSGLPLPSPADLPDPGIKPGSPANGLPVFKKKLVHKDNLSKYDVIFLCKA